MAYSRRGKRDGTGPYKDSWMRQNVGKGRRQMAGEECPYKVKRSVKIRTRKGIIRLTPAAIERIIILATK